MKIKIYFIQFYMIKNTGMKLLKENTEKTSASDVHQYSSDLFLFLVAALPGKESVTLITTKSILYNITIVI